jgi:DNA-binding protein HU-beta
VSTHHCQRTRSLTNRTGSRMPAHTTTPDILVPELETIAVAAANRLQREVAGTDHQPELQRAVAHAASAAIAAGLALGAIADAERLGHQRARDELRPDVLRQITRAARRKRETELEYEQAVIRGARLGLGHRELAGAAQVTHGTVRAIIARTDTSPIDRHTHRSPDRPTKRPQSSRASPTSSPTPAATPRPKPRRATTASATTAPHPSATVGRGHGNQGGHAADTAAARRPATPIGCCRAPSTTTIDTHPGARDHAPWGRIETTRNPRWPPSAIRPTSRARRAAPVRCTNGAVGVVRFNRDRSPSGQGVVLVALTQVQLAAAVADRAGLNKADAKRALAALEDVVLDQLGDAQKVRIGGGVHLTVRVKPATKKRQGRNLATGEQITIAASPRASTFALDHSPPPRVPSPRSRRPAVASRQAADHCHTAHQAKRADRGPTRKPTLLVTSAQTLSALSASPTLAPKPGTSTRTRAPGQPESLPRPPQQTPGRATPQAARARSRARACRRWGRAIEQAAGRLSATAGCGEGTIRRSPAVQTTGPARLSQPWPCKSAARAGGRAEAVVRARAAHAWMGRSQRRGRRCSRRSTAPALPMHARVDGDRQLTFAFVLGGGLRSWRAIGPTRTSGCRCRTIEAPAAQPALAGRAGLPLRWGAPARRRSRHSSAPRPEHQRRRGSRTRVQFGNAAVSTGALLETARPSHKQKRRVRCAFSIEAAVLGGWLVGPSVLRAVGSRLDIGRGFALRPTRKEAVMANHTVVLAFFNEEESAEAAAARLTDSGWR